MIFLNNLEISGANYPSWDTIPDEVWQGILNNFIFKISDSFAFMGVSKKADLFPNGLSYFNNWKLDIIELIEVEDDIVCRFQLNESCKSKLLEYEFAVHSFKSKQFSNYYEFDQLYFFSGNRLVVNYINHESMLDFIDLNETEIKFIEGLEPHIKKFLIDPSVLTVALEAAKMK
ncbi:hypothetical protein [Hymenobacter crusticola]|uniref:Uncharacterized protein n=1 Tax=Hymenobacter crusticola TaxID=1770526 RepID=A0A243WFJ8_9BACT|nr:hypothetical protein [Hymenobacter crusticola]OUJ74542.1 hypothetical protein BXP70_07110 [Hymenobacter crusticola]